VLEPFEANEPLDPLLRRPPQDAVLEDASSERLEMRPSDAPALGFAPVRKAQPEVSKRYPTSLTPQYIKQKSQSAPDRREQLQRQQVQ
jgi:hypothetical protein